MLKVCSGCGRLVTVETEVTTCPYCGEEIRVPLEELAVVTSREGGYSPWDDRERLGAFRAYWETWRRILSAPSAFFTHLPITSDYLGPILFGLLTGVVGNLLGLFWQAVFYSENQPLQTVLSEAGMSLSELMWLAVFLMPIVVLVQFLVWSGILHLLVLAFARGGRGFAGTLRVVCFSSAPHLLYAIPICGGPIAAIWSLVLTVIGLRDVHRISGAVATLVVLIPFVTCLGIFMVALFAALSSVSGLQ